MKKGITISILVVTVVLMFILVTTATVVGTRAIQTASYEEFLSKVVRVSNDVNKYVIDNNALPTTSEIIAKEGLSSALIAEINKNNDGANNLFVIDMTKLRTESVNIGDGTVEDMDVFIVAENTNNVYYLKGVAYRGQTYYGVQIPEITVPKDWIENVVAIVDTVPIPKGFVASPYEGENTKNGGLVIYELKANETAIPSTETQFESWTTRNQYVWVPVEDFTKFKRQNFIEEDRATNISNILGTIDTYWEVVLDANNMPLATQDSNFVTQTNTLTEVQAMYASVKEYKGFYIARYEAGLETQRTTNGVITTNNVYSMMNKKPYNWVSWTTSNPMINDTGGAVQVARSMYPVTNTNCGIVSTLTYSVQWDATLQWWEDTKAVTNLINSTLYGNYKDTAIASKAELNEGANYSLDSGKTYSTTIPEDFKKDNKTSYMLTTGALKASKVKNIYDLAGNLWEWTMEGHSNDGRVIRGASFESSGSNGYVSRRSIVTHNYAYYYVGFRPSLYIKL